MFQQSSGRCVDQTDFGLSAVTNSFDASDMDCMNSLAEDRKRKKDQLVAMEEKCRPLLLPRRSQRR